MQTSPMKTGAYSKFSFEISQEAREVFKKGIGQEKSSHD